MPVLHRDFETQSAAPLKKVGARRYAADPTTRVLCICWAVDDGPIESCIPGSGEPIPGVFVEAANDPRWLVAAHNDAFESAIEDSILGPQFSWPLIPVERHLCTLAMARYRGLPGELGRVATLLDLPVQKDREGARLMLELCKPRKPHKGEDKAQLHWPEITPEKLARLIAYCRNDVAVEREIYRRLPRLPDDEQRLWCLDRKINVLGFRVDLELARAARKLVAAEKTRINTGIATITDGAVTGFTKLNDMREFVNARGHSMHKVNKRAVVAVLAHDPDATVREMLELRQASSNTAVEKYGAVLAGAFPDARVRGLLHYYGTHTGRWTSAGFNIHNLPREDADDALAVIAAILTGDIEQVRAFGPPLDMIAGVARGLVIAPPDKLLLAGDFSTIEPRVASWLAGEKWKLDLFRKFDATGDPTLDVHRQVGARMRGKPVDPTDDEARQHGKTLHMALNYGGGVRVWREQVPDDPRSDAEIKAQEVDKFRQLHPLQTQLMFNLDRQALRCMKFGAPVTCTRHGFELDGDTLILRLPSARPLFYPRARIVSGKFGRDVIAYHNPAKNQEDETWYGTWLAHLVSATARDLLVNALLNLDIAGFAITLHVHDEVLVEADPASTEHDQERFQTCMLQAPAWAEGLPLATKVRIGPRYIKADAPATTTTATMVEVGPIQPDPIHVCTHCRLEPPDGLERVSAHNGGGWLHPQCVDPFLRARMNEEGIPWEDPSLAPVAASPPPPQPSPPPWEDPSWPPSAPPPSPSPPRGNGYADSLNGGSKTKAEHDTYAEQHAGEPFDDAFLRRKGYRLAQAFNYTLADGMLLYQQNRYELRAGIAPAKERPLKRFLPHRKVNGKDVLGAGDRRVIYNWPAIMRAGPGNTVVIAEGESNAKILIDAGLLATTVLSHKWTPECVAALTGHHLVILVDHDKDGERLASDAQKKLAPAGASTRIVSASHLWKHLPPGAREIEPGDDVEDWMALGGDPQRLLDICREISADDASLECVCAADEEIEALDWIWPGRFARGKIGLLTGLPDEGKGLVLSDIMARISRSSSWPCGEGQAPLGNVILLTAEDDINDTIVPRLLAAGADLHRVTIIKMIHEVGKGPRMFSLITDLASLHRKAIDVGDVKMIIIDPITAYLGIGKIDSFRATDVRAVLGPLKEFAAELRLSILAVMHFNKKVDITNVLLRISDSLAYGAAARHVYGVIDDHNNQRKLFVKGKNNLAPRDQKTLAFGFATREVGTDKKTGSPISAPYIVWQAEPVDITATEALQAAAESKSPGARDNAKQFLDALLSDGPLGSKEVHEAAKENGIAPRTLRRAKDELSVEIKKDGPAVDGGRTWQWHLPTSRDV